MISYVLTFHSFANSVGMCSLPSSPLPMPISSLLIPVFSSYLEG